MFCCGSTTWCGRRTPVSVSGLAIALPRRSQRQGVGFAGAEARRDGLGAAAAGGIHAAGLPGGFAGEGVEGGGRVFAHRVTVNTSSTGGGKLLDRRGGRIALGVIHRREIDGGSYGRLRRWVGRK